MFRLSWLRWVSVVCLAAGLSSANQAQAAPGPANEDQAALPLSTAVVSAWEKAGASVGWFGAESLAVQVRCDAREVRRGARRSGDQDPCLA